MKIAYFGFNALSSCLDFLIHQDGIEVVVIYTGPDSEHTEQITQLAHTNNIYFLINKPTINELENLVSSGVDCFICAEYPHKLHIPNSLKYSVNIHPTLLPEGRGQTPLPYLILRHPQHAGITLHKMTDELDQGDIILSHAIDVSEQETFDSLHAKVFLDAPMLLHQMFDNFDHLYNHAKPQLYGSYWEPISAEQQSINWQMTSLKIKTVIRGFGSLGIKFQLNNKDYYFTSAQCNEHQHAYHAGDVIIFDNFKLIIATLDGFIIIPRDNLFEL